VKNVSQFSLIDGFFVLILVGLTLAFYKVIAPFVIDIFLAVIFANFFWKLFDFFLRSFRGRKYFAAGITVLLVLLFFGAILTFVIIVFSGEVSGGIANLREQWPALKERIVESRITEFLRRVPFVSELTPAGESFDLGKSLEELLSRSSSLLIDLARRSFESVSGFVVHLIFTLFILFFLFVDGRKLLYKVKSLIPLGDDDTEQLTREFSSMTKATIISTIIIGFIEGTYGGIIFTIFGLPTPVLWGILILFISIIPIIGANVVIVPAGLIKIISGEIVPGIIIILLGLAGIAVTQNIIKPKLLGGRSGLHPMLVLLSTLGGIAWLGIIGFLLGPLIAALFIVVWNQFGKRFKRELAGKNEP
jgi:predicted PurR-regulated permease PerM